MNLESNENGVPLFYWYFAGKIGVNDWRHSIVGECLRNAPDDPNEFHSIDPLPIKEGPSWMRYVGPFFISCDHGCFHGPNRHGLMGGTFCLDTKALSQREVAAICRKQINRAYGVFAWIDDLTCYGTLAEIGYARALGRRIVIGLSEDFHDLWFVKSLADRWIVQPSALKAFKEIA